MVTVQDVLPPQPLAELKKVEREKQRCEAKGGRWDEQNQTCIMPEPEPKPKKEPEPEPPPVPETFTDVKTGRPSGVTLPSGETFLGLNTDEIEELVAKKAAQTAQPAGTAPFGTAEAEAQAAARVQELQSTGRPVRRELDPTLEPFETTPVIGPLLVKIKKALVKSGFDQPALLDVLKGEPGQEDFFELQPEELKSLALTQIEKNEIERGLTDSEKFGSFVESVPAGELAKYIPGLGSAERPSDNVQTVLKSLRILKSRSIDVELKYQKGLLTQAGAEERIALIENEIQQGESRMKLLIQDSPELKFNSDGVNFIELKILEARERLFDSRIAVSSGVQGDPSEIDILLALQENVQTEDFEIPE